MKLRHRRILYLVFFVIFIILAPIIIFWAQGYRYNWTKKRVEKTGVIFIESKPEKNEVCLNGKLYKKATTVRIKNLLADVYQIEVKRPTYQTWSKKLEVVSGQTTFAQYIRLFKENPEIESVLNKKIVLSSEQNKNQIAVIYESVSSLQLATFDLENYELKDLTKLNYLPEKISFSQNNDYILIEYNPEYAKSQWIFDIDEGKLIDLKAITLETVENLHWSADSKNEIFFKSSRGVEKIDLKSKKISLLSKKPLIDFYLTNNLIFFLEKSTENVLLKKAKLNDFENSELVANLPLSNFYAFQNGNPENILSLIDQKNELLYLINVKEENEKDKIKIFTDANFVNWLGNMLLFGNNFELSVYDWDKNKEETIVRLSSPIKKAVWYPTATHVIYLINNEVKIIEILGSEKNMQILINLSDIKNIFANSKGDKIYFINNSGVNKALIQ